MDWVEGKSVWGLRPELAEVFVWRKSLEGLESSGEVVGSEEVVQVRFELVVGVVEVALDGGVFDSAVHAFDLSIRPGMVWFGQPVFDSMDAADAIEGVSSEARSWSLAVLRQVGELDSVVGEHGVDAVRNGFNERLEEGRSGPHVGFFDEFDHSELRSPINGHEQVELAFGGPHLGQVDVEEADWIGVELLSARLVALNFGQAADAMTLQASMKRRAGELRDRRLQRVQTVVKRQQRVLAKRDDDGFMFHTDRTVDLGTVGPVRRSAVDSRFFHLATVFGLMP